MTSQPWRIGGLVCRTCCDHDMNRADTECIAFLHLGDPDRDRLWFECPSCQAPNYQRLTAENWISLLGAHTALPVVSIPPEYDEPHSGKTISEHEIMAFAADMGKLSTAPGHSLPSTGRSDP